MTCGAGTGRGRLDHRPDHRAGGGLGPAAVLAGLHRRGGTLVWADTEQVHSGYVTTSTATYSAQGYALASDSVRLHGLGLFVDRVRIRITSSDPSRPLFAGIAATGDVERYLGDVSYTTVHGYDVTNHPGTGVPAAPAAAVPWAARAQGTGTLTLTWTVRDGDWTVVVMNTDARPGLSVRAHTGYRRWHCRGWPVSCWRPAC
jgi:hypothetical protein